MRRERAQKAYMPLCNVAETLWNQDLQMSIPKLRRQPAGIPHMQGPRLARPLPQPALEVLLLRVLIRRHRV
jgi:hypothetical protein